MGGKKSGSRAESSTGNAPISKLIWVVGTLATFSIITFLRPDFFVGGGIDREDDGEKREYEYGDPQHIVNLQMELHNKDMEIQSLKESLSRAEGNAADKPTGYSPPLPNAPSSSCPVCAATSKGGLDLGPPLTPLEAGCERRYGLSLIDEWRNAGQTWCAPDGKSSIQTEIKCYPLHQAHKKLDGRGPDLFCEGTNIFMDFAKISGDIRLKKTRGAEMYLNFKQGATYGTCKKTSDWKSRMFMPHNARQMEAFLADASVPNTFTYSKVDHVTYLLARDEDCENTFHSTADFMNMMLVMRALGIKPGDQQVVLFDNHKDGPYLDLIKNAFSPNHPVIRHQDFKGKTVLFKKLIFHLESPAGLIFPRVANPDPLRCHSADLFQEYRKFVLDAFNLYNVLPPSIPSISLILRHRTKEKNVGRVLANEDEVRSLLQKGNMVDVNVVDFSQMSFADQLKLIRRTNIMVGVHGAGLMHIMFAAEEAVLVEIHPSYRQDRHFRHAARMTGKIYMPVRATKREECVGSSDNVWAPMEELKLALDGAVRAARNFDDGISECGLICNPQILAIDKRLNNYYKPNEQRSNPLMLRFPCH